MLATCRKLIERRRNIGANWMKKRSAHLNMAMAAVRCSSICFTYSTFPNSLIISAINTFAVYGRMLAFCTTFSRKTELLFAKKRYDIVDEDLSRRLQVKCLDILILRRGRPCFMRNGGAITIIYSSRI